jgi:hypothetical protein
MQRINERNDLHEKPEEHMNSTADLGITDVFIERPLSTHDLTHPVNGKSAPLDDDEDESEEDDLILGDEDEASGDEEEFDVELDDDIDEDDIGEDDLIIDKDDDIDDDDEEDDL